MSHDKAETVCKILSAERADRMKTALAVGCGTGEEAASLARTLGLDVMGIDRKAEFSEDAGRHARLMRGDAMALEFPDASFDLVYCFHVLEHVQSPARVLREIARVLKDDGLFWIGTPNRLRLIGYVGGGGALGEVVRWNLADWKARARGSFTNEEGAHAGFSQSELRQLLSPWFRDIEPMTRRYYAAVHGRLRVAVDLLARTGCGNVLFPSVYFLARRPLRDDGGGASAEPNGAAAGARRRSSGPERDRDAQARST
jgi:ubiquinone/menaquinone biosynthesis C-methylase UbiE